MNISRQRKAGSGQRAAIFLQLLAVSCSLPAVRCRPVMAAEPAYYNYLRGMLEEREGNLTKALDAYEKAVAEDPGALEVFRDIAQVNLRLGKTDAALRAAEKVRDLAPKDPSSFIFLGNVNIAQGNLAKAAEAYEKALELDPQNLRALENLGNYYAIVDPEKALSYYQRYLALDPDDAEMHFQMGMVLHKIGQEQKSKDVFAKAIALDPRQAAPHLALAEIYDQKQSTAAAIAEFEKASELQPGNPIVDSKLAHLYYSSGRYEDAYRKFTDTLKNQPKDPTLQYWLARTAEEMQQWPEAEGHALKAYELSQDVQFLPLLAYYYTLDRRPADAVKWLEKARSINPKNANIYLFLGINYLEVGKPEKARDALQRGVSLAPQDIQMLFQLGVAKDRLGKSDDAAADFAKVLQVDPENTAAMNYLGYTWADRGERLPEAEKLLRKAVTLEPDNGAYLDSLGWVRYKQGDLKEAATLLEKAVKLNEDALIYDHLGEVYLAAKDFSKAAAAWREALRLSPGNAVFQKKLDSVSTRITPGSESRKWLKTFEGNQHQISDLRGRVSVQAKWNKRSVRVEGTLFYKQPDRVVLRIPGARNAPDIRLIVEQTRIRVEPPEWAESITPQAMEGLRSLPMYFSGEMILPLDQADTSAETVKEGIRYTTASQEAWIDPKQGSMLTQWIRKNPEGGRDEMIIEEYRQIEGLWLPFRMRLKNRALGWDARVQFSDWVVNHPDNSQPFK